LGTVLAVKLLGGKVLGRRHDPSGAINNIKKMLMSTDLIDTQSKSAIIQTTQCKNELTSLDGCMEKLMTR
jgi:hypothetical protein